MPYKAILKTIPTIQSASLLSENIREMKRKKKRPIRMGVRNIVGSSLIDANADFLGGI